MEGRKQEDAMRYRGGKRGDRIIMIRKLRQDHEQRRHGSEVVGPQGVCLVVHWDKGRRTERLCRREDGDIDYRTASDEIVSKMSHKPEYPRLGLDIFHLPRHVSVRDMHRQWRRPDSADSFAWLTVIKHCRSPLVHTHVRGDGRALHCL